MLRTADAKPESTFVIPRGYPKFRGTRYSSFSDPVRPHRVRCDMAPGGVAVVLVQGKDPTEFP